jgi:hypothetical protein
MTEPHRKVIAPSPPGKKNEQAPLGPDPSYDEVLDLASELSFPASDPIAVESCCKDCDKEQKAIVTAPGAPRRA